MNSDPVSSESGTLFASSRVSPHSSFRHRLPSPRVLAVDDKDHSFVGYVIYHDYDDESKEIGWVLKKDAWGQGMAGLLTKQLLAMASAEGKDTVIECVPEQRITRIIAEKHGFRRTGERNGLVIYRSKRDA